ncbi:hypothetical protein EBU71_20515 [bacterium]|nr:hypothetical protein [Candidatus Elulimicrobium humile]
MSSISFPLYDTLVSSLPPDTPDQTSIDPGKLVKNINTLDQDGKNKVYALIRYYYLLHTCDEPQENVIPFGGCFVDNELVFDLKQFPIILQHILMEFTRVHLKHMKYTQKIDKIRKKST